ncbi:hypothetical protein D9619_005996 [Psilocybe cf. subviscida]|uniref:SRR1-like domain-containing protein n=1 Tax=Psilocybe cf. subviscida TaxID=2480587 RepID=A0A8H5BWQ2_9AGAR|nr:hypothetical protein D9619_005996 [Psilocybe cf. subviscida]
MALLMAANISSSFSYADFTPVKPRKNRKNRPQRTELPISPPVIDALRAQLRADDWFAQCSHVIEREWTAKFSRSTNARVVCLGLGSPSASPIARTQLAFLVELSLTICGASYAVAYGTGTLRHHTVLFSAIIPDVICLYDPVFSADDSVLFSAMNMHVLPWANSAPEYALDKETPTLWFMPHCDMELYEALLRANWTPESLASCFLLGNQLQEYIDK